jgi:hypothetical protein
MVASFQIATVNYDNDRVFLFHGVIMSLGGTMPKRRSTNLKGDRVRVYLTLPPEFMQVFNDAKDITGMYDNEFVEMVFTMFYKDVIKTLADQKIKSLQKYTSEEKQHLTK